MPPDTSIAATVADLAERYPDLDFLGHVDDEPALRDRITDAEGLRRRLPSTPLVERWLNENTLAWLAGKPGHGKTFVALDLALSVATGTPWLGHAVTRRRVLYVIAEGADGLVPRIDAWEASKGRAATGIQFLPYAVQLSNAKRVDELSDLISFSTPGLIVFDTQARTTVGLDENSARDMGTLIAALDLIRNDSAGACVLMVHHEARNSENLRGSTALEGAADTIIRVAKDGPLLSLQTVKQKDAEPAPPLQVALEPVGGSAVITTDLDTPRTPLSSAERKVLATLEELGETSQGGVTTAAGLGKSSARRALHTLLERRLVDQVTEGRTVTWRARNRDPQPRGSHTGSRPARSARFTSDPPDATRPDLPRSARSTRSANARPTRSAVHHPFKGVDPDRTSPETDSHIPTEATR